MMPIAGPLAGQMLIHILLMNVAAPGIALAARPFVQGRLNGSGRSLFLATVVQISLLWGWHTPAALEAATHGSGLHLAMQANLFAAALWFWTEIVLAAGRRHWQSIFALLVTGKLFCLLGVLFVFAPRPLFYELGSLHDQQLAGLLMIISCPLAYVLAAVILAARWLGEIENRPDALLRLSEPHRAE